jgi:hypothetical protein
MDILDKARRLEGHIARGLAGVARNLARSDGPREPIELAHAIADAVEREVQIGGRGARVFPFNTIEVSIAAPSDHARTKLDIVLDGEFPLRERIRERLVSAGCAVDDLAVTVTYVGRAQKHWPDPQFAMSFSKAARTSPPSSPSPAPTRLDIVVTHGVAEHRTYTFACERIDVGRGTEVRDAHDRLIRTNHVAFADPSDPVNLTVSRQHAHVAYDPRSREFRLHDDGSAQGTRVVRKGRTVPVPSGTRGVRLQSGDEVVLGAARLRIKC